MSTFGELRAKQDAIETKHSRMSQELFDQQSRERTWLTNKHLAETRDLADRIQRELEGIRNEIAAAE